MSHSNTSNAAESPFLKLPMEVRHMILQMVFGNKTIHLSQNSNQQSREPCNTCERSLCIAKEPGHGDKSFSGNRSYNWSDVHHDCISSQGSGRIERIDFSIFSTNRQIYHESFRLFWRTSQFCFRDGETLKTFLGHLNKAQTESVKHLVICCSFTGFDGEADNWDWSRLWYRTKEQWLLSDVEKGTDFCFPELAKLELHLQLYGYLFESGYRQQAHGGAFRAAFAAFETLRHLRLQEALVTMSYVRDEYAIQCLPSQLAIIGKNLANIAQNFRERLLDRTVYEKALMEPLIDKIKHEIERLKVTFREAFENFMSDLQESEWPYRCIEYDEKAIASRTRAKRLAVRLNGLQAALLNDDYIRMKTTWEQDHKY